MTRTWHTAVAAAMAVCVVAGLEATTARKLSNQDLASQADLIFIGRAGDAHSMWQDRTLVTLVSVTVSERLKGDSPDTVTVVLPGGIDANRKFPIAMTYPGAPELRLGEDVFLFLGRDEDGISGYTVLGFSQGKFSIAQEPNGRKVVTRDLTQILLQGGEGTVRGVASYVALDDFRNEIIGYLK